MVSPIIKLISIYLFMFVVFQTNIINPKDELFLRHKLFLFLIMFTFSVLFELVIKIRNRCKIDMDYIISTSLRTSLATVVGYSIYNDLARMEWSQYYLDNIINSSIKNNLFVSILIIMFIIIINVIEYAFSLKQKECVQYD